MPYQTIHPATGALVRSFADSTGDELDAAVTVAHYACAKDWRHRAVAERASVVSLAARRLRDNAEEYAAYVTLEMGKLIAEARAEVALSADILDYYATRAAAYLMPQALADAPGSIVEVLPLGIILCVEPWNFPYYQLARVAGPQLMVGNVVMVKHAGSPSSAMSGLAPRPNAAASCSTSWSCSSRSWGRPLPRTRPFSTRATKRRETGILPAPVSAASRCGGRCRRICRASGW